MLISVKNTSTYRSCVRRLQGKELRIPLRSTRGASGPAYELLAGIRKTLKRSYFCLTAALMMTIPAWPQEQPKDLAEKSIEDLMNMEVTSVSKKEQKLSSVAAAIFVITQEDIRHSGATNIPDLLRMFPGLDVAQINANTWAISARGLTRTPNW